MNEKMIDNLSNKIWITRKCRINSSERLIISDRISKFLLSYYNLVILSMSIWSIYVVDETKHLSFIVIIASLFVFGGAFGINSLNYKERIKSLKSCYIDLDTIYGDIEILKNNLSTMTSEDSISKYETIREKYKKLLDEVENHNAYDFLKFQCHTKEYRKWYLLTTYCVYNIIFILLFIILLLLPFIPFMSGVFK